jgi:beta-glucanase (GH16 family)
MIEWSSFKWNTQERWGQHHPEKPLWWYDASSIKITPENHIHLETKLNPKHFDKTMSEIGVGLISCTEKFKFGEFEIECKLPQGKNQWPAFWMWSWDSWPPEIDIFEGYSDNKFGYFRFNPFKSLGIWDIQTNLHYITSSKNKMIGGKYHWMGLKNPSKHFIKYKLVWTPDKLEFYYGGRLVRKITDGKLLSQLNNTSMNVVINNGITKNFKTVDLLNSTPFIIKYFKYTPL